jgi:hypothetical protein
MIRLHTATRDQRVRPVRLCFRANQLQLPHLVAAKSERNGIVTLRDDRRAAAERGAQARQLLDRGRRIP